MEAMNKLEGPSTAAAVKRVKLYTECCKNHGARWGEHARDGCQEFVPSSNELDQALECAVCGCHRNVHRKTISKDDHHWNINVQYQSCCKNHGARIGKYSTDSCKEFLASESDPLKCEVCGCHRNFHRKSSSSSSSSSSSGTTSSANSEASDGQYAYGECFKNHGASAGEYSKDGCHGFVGSERSSGALCHACGCHRNFHRREQVAEDEMNLNAQYGDCCKNYGAWNGDYMRDGCEEFVGRERHGVSYNYVPACDACGCHRSFHRKKVRKDGGGGGGGGEGGGGGSSGGNSCNSVKYGKCRKNHGAYDVVYRTDGCEEFVGSERSVVRCKSCGCHRNFHRKIVVEVDDDGDKSRAGGLSG